MMEGTFDYFDGSDVYFAFYQNDVQVNTMPTKESGYVFNSIKSNCTNEAILKWNQDEWSPLVTNLTKTKTKCTLYFNQGTNLGEAIFKNETGKNNVSEAKQVIEAKGIPDFSQVATTNEGMYATADDYGTSYYYRGAVENNYLKFADFYWRIIRVNGDGSIRIIYNGDKPNQRGEHTKIRTGSFNNLGNNPSYVGYVNGRVLNTSYNQTHANEIDSNIKKVLDQWYVDNIYRKGYHSYISDEIFCNDRSIGSGDGISTKDYTYFGAYNRIHLNQRPSLVCPQDNDMFTTTISAVGNKTLTYPIALITADEGVMAGAVSNASNQSFYLHTTENYWTMSPSQFHATKNIGIEWTIYPDGKINGMGATTDIGIRPVINLKAKTNVIEGTGTSNDPYVVI